MVGTFYAGTLYTPPSASLDWLLFLVECTASADTALEKRDSDGYISLHDNASTNVSRPVSTPRSVSPPRPSSIPPGRISVFPPLHALTAQQADTKLDAEHAEEPEQLAKAYSEGAGHRDLVQEQ